MRKVLVTIVAVLAVTPGAGKAHAAGDDTAPLTGGRLLMRTAACGSSEAVPAGLDAAAVTKHCARLEKLIAKYKARWLDKATPFFRRVVPSSIPTKVVYPFGGGDLLTALAVFPNLTQVTTISLEPAGDAEAISSLAPAAFRSALNQLRGEMEFFLRSSFSRTRHMHVFMTNGKLPGQLVFSLLALSVHGYELHDLRYFALDAKGNVSYLDASKRRLVGAAAFDNVELRFRKAGDPTAAMKTFRHVRQNLADAYLAKAPHFLAHLRSQGKVSVMTKAASYLLWWRKFSTLRAYLLANMEWMISDSSGMLPRYLRGTNFEQVTYGRFEGNILVIAAYLTAEAERLWKRNRYRRLGFRFGYPDKAGNASLMITRKRSR